VYEPTVWWFEHVEFLISFMKPRKEIDSIGSLEEVSFEFKLQGALYKLNKKYIITVLKSKKPSRNNFPTKIVYYIPRWRCS
jgi:hypothetical protein